MGASASARRNGEGPDDATAGEQNVEAIEVQEGEDADAKLVQKNGQISNLSGKTEDGTGDFNGQAGEKGPEEVGQADAETEKEDVPEKMEELKGEADPQVEVKKQEKESAGTDELTSVDTVGEGEKPSETNEVGFKKIFRFVGFKVTLKKDKNEKNDPVQLLTVKKEEGEASASDVAEEAATEEPKEKGLVEASKENGVVEEDKKEGAEEESTEKGPTEEIKPEEKKETPEEPQAEEAGAESPAAEEATVKLTTDTEEQAAESEEPTEEVTSEKENEAPTESQTSPAVQETQSPLKRFFTQGIFSNLRKKTSFKKTKEEELQKDVAVKEEIKEIAEETTESPKEGEETIEETMAEAQQKESTSTEESKAELLLEVPDAVVEQKEDEIKAEITVEADSPQTTPEEVTESLPAEGAADVTSTEAKAESSVEGQVNQEEIPSAEVPAAITTEAELLSSQEKNKAQGSPLKKLLTGSGLKKLSSKKQKIKKEAEAKLTESGDHVSEQLQSSCESAEGQKGESSPSSPEESVEHVIGEPGQTEVATEIEGEGDKKKDGILPWASFKKLVTPKKRVKKSSDSEDEAPEKPKSATLSSTDSAVFVEKQEEPKPAEEEQKTEPCTEEPKKKMDTSVSWEALICVGSSKKRARKTSDSDDETPRIEEEQPKTAEAVLGSSQEADQENLTSSPEQAGSPSEGDGVSTWESLKRFVTPRRKVKVEDKAEEATAGTASEQIPSDSEIPKEESSFSLKKLIPGRRKKKSDGKQEQVSSDEAGKSLGSAEEDSDTPAVVPLSEYDSEQVEQDNIASKDTVAATEIPASTTQAEESKQETTVSESEGEKPITAVPITGPQVKAVADAEERLPSWISPTAVADIQETAECIIKQPLSDIPEEGDTIATPKSTAEEASRDDTIAEDIVELTSEVTTAVEQVPEVSFTEETTEMVSAVSRLTESPGTSGDTTPVQAEYDMDKTEAILLEAVQTITHTENVQSLTMTDVQQESVAVSVTPQVLESATNEEAVILELHAKSKASTICTGLDSQELESAEEKTLQASVESITEVGKAISTEVVVEEKTEKSEVATVREDCVFVAEVQELKTEAREPKPLSDVEETAQQVEVQVETVKRIQDTDVLLMGEVKHMPDHEHADMLQDPKPVKVALVNLVQGASEVLEEPVVAENTLIAETEGPLDTTIEESLRAHTAHITEVSLVKADAVQEIEAIKEDVAEAEVTPLEVVKQCVIQEVTVSMPEPPTAEISDIKEAPIAVVAPTAELLASNEATCVIKPLSESIPSEVAEVKDEVVLESDREVQVSVTSTEIPIVEAALGVATDATPTSISTTAEDVSVKEEELKEMLAEQIQEAETVKEDSTAVAEAVIQNVDLKMEQVKGAGITAVTQVVTQKVDLEVMQTEQKKEAEHVEVERTSDAEVVSKNALDDLSKQGSESGIAEQEEGKEMVPGSSKAEEEASGEKAVKEETEEPKEPILPETIQEAVQVETTKVSQSEFTESSAVPAEIHQEDISVKPSEDNKQEIDVTAQDKETQTRQEQAEDKRESLATQEVVKGKDEPLLERQEEAAAVTEEKKSKDEVHEVEAELQEQSRVADMTCEDDQASETVLQEQVQHEDVEVPSTVKADTTEQTVVEPINKEVEKQTEEDLTQGAGELSAKDDAVPVVSQDAETADHGDGTVSGELESQEAPAEDGMTTETGDPKASATETEAKAQDVSMGCPSATDADSVEAKKTMGQMAISDALEVAGAVILEKASELQPVLSEQTAAS